MSRHASVELDFGDGTYTFRLGLSEIEELEEKRRQSLFVIARGLDPETRKAHLRDIMEVIRLGLIGGGMKPVEALGLVRRYVDRRPIDESRHIAYLVVLAGLMRVHSGDLADGDASSGETAVPEPNGSTSAPFADQP